MVVVLTGVLGAVGVVGAVGAVGAVGVVGLVGTVVLFAPKKIPESTELAVVGEARLVKRSLTWPESVHVKYLPALNWETVWESRMLPFMSRTSIF